MSGQQPLKVDPAVWREIRRYRALRAVGLLEQTTTPQNHGCAPGICENCYRTIWLRAGEEDLYEAPEGAPADIVAAIMSELEVAAKLTGKLASRRMLAEAERQRLKLASARLESARDLLRGSR